MVMSFSVNGGCLPANCGEDRRVRFWLGRNIGLAISVAEPPSAMSLDEPMRRRFFDLRVAQNKANCSATLAGMYSRIGPRGPGEPIPYFFLNLLMSALRCLRYI